MSFAYVVAMRAHRTPTPLGRPLRRRGGRRRRRDPARGGRWLRPPEPAGPQRPAAAHRPARGRAPALSGTVVETAHLGLPELPTPGGAGSAELSWPNLVTGSHTLRVWLDGPEKQRVALVGELAESDVVHNGTSVWLYSSRANQATQITVPADAGKSAEDQVIRQLPTPAEAAAQAIAAITPTTKISVDDTARVAGRPAYQLVLQPKDSARSSAGEDRRRQRHVGAAAGPGVRTGAADTGVRDQVHRRHVLEHPRERVPLHPADRREGHHRVGGSVLTGQRRRRRRGPAYKVTPTTGAGQLPPLRTATGRPTTESRRSAPDGPQ